MLADFSNEVLSVLPGLCLLDTCALTSPSITKSLIPASVGKGRRAERDDGRTRSYGVHLP